MGTKSRETIYGSSAQAAAERAKEARREADRLGRRRLEQADAWLSWSGAAIADAGRRLNAGYGYLEVKCLGCESETG